MKNPLIAQFVLIVCSFVFAPGYGMEETSPIAAGAAAEKAAGDFKFIEGVTADPNNNLYFSDLPANCIYKLTPEGKVSKFIDTQRSNGLQIDKDGTIVACESTGGRRLIRITMDKKFTVLADRYEGKLFNSLNDLWIDPEGGIYMTDPRYGNRDNMEQDGEHVYYLTPDGKQILRVIQDMERPNGIIGTPDGKILYVADHKGGKTWKYSVNSDGTLANKKLFCLDGSDGMTIDNEGNIYLTTRQGVKIYNADAELIETIQLSENPSNVCFGDADRKTLYITAQTSLYKIRMRTCGVGSN